MADITITANYELTTPDPITGGMATFAHGVESLSVIDTADGVDSLTLTVGGRAPADMKLDGAISVTVNHTLYTQGVGLSATRMATRTWSGFRVAGITDYLYPERTRIIAKRTLDEDAIASAILAHMESPGILAQYLSGRYPLQTRWDGMLRPTGAVASAPNIWAYISEQVGKGGNPTYGRLVQTLAAFGLEIWIRDSAADLPVGYVRLSAAGVHIAIVPMNHRTLFAQSGNPQPPDAARAIADEDIAVDEGTAIVYADAADIRLDRAIQFSVPIERAGEAKLADIQRDGTPTTLALYRGGSTGDPIILKDAYERPHYGNIALEGERARRYLSNQTMNLRTYLDLEAQVRDCVSVAGDDWIVTSIAWRITPAMLESELTLRRYRALTPESLYANSPAPFNTAAGWDEIHKRPKTPELELVLYTPATQRIQRIAAGEAALQANGGGAFTVGIKDGAAGDPRADSTSVSVSQGTNLITNARTNGRGVAIPFVDAGADTVYTIRCRFANEWGESDRAEIQVRTAANQLPSTTLMQARPKIIRQQLEWIPDQLFQAYSALQASLEPSAVTNEDGALGTGSAVNSLGLGLNDDGASLGGAVSVGLVGLAGAATVGGVVIASAVAATVLTGGGLAAALAGQIAITLGGGSLIIFAGASSSGVFISFATPTAFAGALGGGGAFISFTGIGAVVAVIISAALAFYIAQSAAENNGMELLAYADGHGYEVTDILFQVRTRTGAQGTWSDWDNMGDGGGGLNPFSTQTYSGGEGRTELVSNDPGTVKQVMQFDPISSGGGGFTTNQYQYRVCAITSQNAKRSGESDQQWFARLEGDDKSNQPKQWVESVVFRGADIDKLWVEVYDNPDGDGLAVRRYSNTRPTFPKATQEGGGG